LAVTIKDVAARAGVSTAAVSYVLNGRATQEKIPAETAQRILAVAREMQYRPNALARGLAGASTRAIRVVLQDAQWFAVWSGFMSEMMRGLAATASREDFELVLHTRRSAQESLESELAHILDGRTDGAVLMRNFNDPLLTHLTERGFPFVLMFSHADDPRIATVDCDNVLGGRLATEYLLDLGHRRILHIAGGKEDSSPGTRRRQGFEEAMRTRGIEPRPDWIIEAWQMSNAAALAPVVAALCLPPEERPTAIFAWYDGVALRIMEIARELSLRIPEDLSLIGFDGTDMGTHTSPPLTTMRQPIVEIASHAITQVAQRLRGESVSISRTLFTPELILRASCAPLS
jgi:LacI family transcriptional regulator